MRMDSHARLHEPASPCTAVRACRVHRQRRSAVAAREHAAKAFRHAAKQPRKHTAHDLQVPLSYLFVEAFRLCMLALAHGDFPFPVLGAVLARNTSRQTRPIAADEALTYRCGTVEQQPLIAGGNSSSVP